MVAFGFGLHSDHTLQHSRQHTCGADDEHVGSIRAAQKVFKTGAMFLVRCSDAQVDIQGSPITESAHLTERLKRLNFGLMQVEIAVDDPKAYTKPWSVTIEMALQVDTQMLEEICMDNEKDTKLYKK
jgi:hypothetical protein